MSLFLILALFLPLQAAPSDKCSLSGTVVDSVTGAPLNKVELRLEPIDRQATPVAVTTSDAKGYFAMDDLDPGRYRLKGRRSGYLEMSYGARRPNSDGTPLQLEGGPAAQDLTFKLTPTAVIAGTVRDSDGEPIEGAEVTYTRTTYRSGRLGLGDFGGAETDDGGEYRVSGLVPGKYYIEVWPGSRSDGLPSGDFEFRAVPAGAYELSVRTQSLWGGIPVSVDASNVEDLRVVLAPLAEVKARIAVEGEIKPKLGGHGLDFVGHRGNSTTSLFADDGSASAMKLEPDRYQVSFFGNLPPGFYVKSIRSGEADVLADGLTVTASGAATLEVVIAPDAGDVQGGVSDKDQQPVAGATIVLAPAQRTRMDLFKTTTSDQNGHYELGSISPGDYKLFAWDDVEPGAWNDPDFLKDYEKQGEKIALEPKARATLSLHLATGPDAQ